jgi:hypothetical protein
MVRKSFFLGRGMPVRILMRRLKEDANSMVKVLTRIKADGGKLLVNASKVKSREK